MADESTMTTTIQLEGAVNARDLGGTPLHGGLEVAHGVLLRSDNLQDLTPADIELLIGEHGLRTVIDLRTEYERDSEGPGPLESDDRVTVEHHSLYPATGGGTDLDLEPGTVRPWGDSSAGGAYADELPTVRAYLGYLARRPDSIVASLRAIATSDGATLVHCAAGKDRTGTVVALALAVAGASPDDIEADYVATTPNIEAIIARLVASPTYRDELSGHDPSHHAPTPGTMPRVFELLERDHGGVEVWLLEAGLTAAEIDALRTRLAGT